MTSCDTEYEIVVFERVTRKSKSSQKEVSITILTSVIIESQETEINLEKTQQSLNLKRRHIKICRKNQKGRVHIFMRQMMSRWIVRPSSMSWAV